RRGLTSAGLAGPLLATAGATAMAILVGVAASPLTAVGVSSGFDPASGITVDWSVLAVGATAVAASLLVVGVFAARRAAVHALGETVGAPRRRALGSRLAGAGVAPIAVVLGVRS